FFQAEDGIRDKLVTGVQTCALPISHRARWPQVETAVSAPLDALAADVAVDPSAIEKNLAELWRTSKEVADDALTRAALWNVVAQIGRASCREGAQTAGGRRRVEHET